MTTELVGAPRPSALPPTPGEWLADAIRVLGYTKTHVGHLIARDRRLITRWTSGREPIPKKALRDLTHVLAPSDETYVTLLSDFEEERRGLESASRDVSRRLGIDSGALVAGLLSPTSKVPGAWPREAAVSEALAVAVEGRFMIGLLERIVQRRGSSITRENVARHLRYPTNLVMETLLQLDLNSIAGPTFVREMVLDDLRSTYKADVKFPVDRLVRHHALHMLGRCGDEVDREMVFFELEAGRSKDDPLVRKLGYCGLMMVPGLGQELADEFQVLLRKDEYLRAADLAFDATHYGDLALGQDGDLVEPAGPLPKLGENIVRHFLEPARYGQIAEADAVRMLGILDHGGLRALSSRTFEMLYACLEYGLIPSGSSEGRILDRRLKTLLGPSTRLSMRVRLTEERRLTGAGGALPSTPAGTQSRASGVYIVVESGGTVNTGDTFNNRADQIEIGAQGSHARVERLEQKQHAQVLKVDVNELVDELRQIQRGIQEGASQPEEFRVIADVVEAIEAAEKGDNSRLTDRLKAAGQYALDVAKSIGTTVAAEAIKKSMGL